MFPARVVAGVKALACEMPAASGMPLARWTSPELARHAAASGIAPAPSASTVRRWLADDVLKPQSYRFTVLGISQVPLCWVIGAAIEITRH